MAELKDRFNFSHTNRIFAKPLQVINSDGNVETPSIDFEQRIRQIRAEKAIAFAEQAIGLTREEKTALARIEQACTATGNEMHTLAKIALRIQNKKDSISDLSVIIKAENDVIYPPTFTDRITASFNQLLYSLSPRSQNSIPHDIFDFVMDWNINAEKSGIDSSLLVKHSNNKKLQ